MLAKNLNANGVFPKHFSSTFDTIMAYDSIPVSVKFGSEIEISFAPKGVHNVTEHFKHSLIGRFKSKKERASLLVQRAIRRWQARQRLRKRQKALHELRETASEEAVTMEEKHKMISRRLMRQHFAELSRMHAALLDGIEYMPAQTAWPEAPEPREV